MPAMSPPLLNLLIELQCPVGSLLDVRHEFHHHFASLVDFILGFFQLSMGDVESSGGNLKFSLRAVRPAMPVVKICWLVRIRDHLLSVSNREFGSQWRMAQSGDARIFSQD